MCVGTGPDGTDVYLPFHALLPMVQPGDIVFDGWDISSLNLADAMQRAQVLDYNLQVSPSGRDQVIRCHLIHGVN